MVYVRAPPVHECVCVRPALIRLPLSPRRLNNEAALASVTLSPRTFRLALFAHACVTLALSAASSRLHGAAHTPLLPPGRNRSQSHTLPSALRGLIGCSARRFTPLAEWRIDPQRTSPTSSLPRDTTRRARLEITFTLSPWPCRLPAALTFRTLYTHSLRSTDHQQQP